MDHEMCVRSVLEDVTVATRNEASRDILSHCCELTRVVEVGSSAARNVERTLSKLWGETWLRIRTSRGIGVERVDFRAHVLKDDADSRPRAHVALKRCPSEVKVAAWVNRVDAETEATL